MKYFVFSSSLVKKIINICKNEDRNPIFNEITSKSITNESIAPRHLDDVNGL